MGDIGSNLREARIRSGLTIKDAESTTKIRAKYLEALEENDFEVLPGATFVKACLRTYATYLKLDADALVGEYRAAHEPRNDDQIVIRPETSQRRRSATSAERRRKRAVRHQRGYVLIGVTAVVIIALLAWWSAGRGQDSASLDASNISGVTTSVGPTGGAGTTVTGGNGALSGQTATTGNAGAGSATTQTTAANGGNIITGEDVTLVISVKEGKSFLVVREDGEDGSERFAGTLSAGTEQKFEGAKRYWLTVGAPQVLALSINGVPYTLEEPAGSFVVTEAGVKRMQ